MADSASNHGHVAEHYNAVPNTGLAARTKSRIFYQRNLNNWIKSFVIDKFLSTIKQGNQKDVNVLDLCCGKGGDLLKWKVGAIHHLVCADVAEVSLEQCKERYEEMLKRELRGSLFSAEFIHADCAQVRLSERYQDPNQRFDLVSCQFSLHYSFSDIVRARTMLRNSCESLQPGGYFIGTIPDADYLVANYYTLENQLPENEVLKINFVSKPPLPLFGAKYEFSLEEVVNCPEYLIYFPLLEKMLEDYDMELVYKQSFTEIVAENAAAESHQGKGLLARMQGLEPYPPDDDIELMGKDIDREYSNAKLEVSRLEKAEEDCSAGQNQNNDQCDRVPESSRKRPIKVGTLSSSEWDVICIYIAFAFRKRSPATKDN